MNKTYESYKDSKIAWIGNIPSDWEVCRIKDSASLYTGNSIKDEEKDFYSDSEDARPYIATKDIDATYLSANYENGLYIKHEDPNFRVAPCRSSLICIEGGSAGKKKAFVEKEVSFVNKLCCFSPNKRIDGKYLFYFLCSPNFEDVFSSKITGLIGGVNIPTLKDINILLPSIKEQELISNYLDTKCSEIDSLISLQEQMISDLVNYRKSIITEAVTKGLNRNVKIINSGIEWIGEIPEGWKVIRIKWLLNERKERSVTGSEEPLSMSQKYGLIPTKDMDSIPNMASSFIGAKITYPGDIVFNKLKAHLGVFSVSQYYGLVSPDYAVYYPTALSDAKYLEYLFKTSIYINEFKKRSSGVGAGLTRLYTSDLFDIHAICPPISIQKEIAQYIDAKTSQIDSLISIKQAKIQDLKDYKKSIIFEYVTGKKRV